MRWIKRFVLIGIALGLLGLLVYAMQPQPVLVDIVEVERGPMEVTVEEDGQTRIKERYIVSTPLSGRLLRIDLDPGDRVFAGETTLARMEPTDPELLDPRFIAQVTARVKAAEGRLKQAEAELERARAAVEFAEAELGRATRLEQSGALTDAALDEKRLLYRTRVEEQRAAAFATDIARYEVELERAALQRTSTGDDEDGPVDNEFAIRSPITGKVLRVFQESAAVLTAGARLIEVGDPLDLEVVVDVLSRDAVRIEPGARVQLEEWGGSKPLNGTVRLVEPAGFTKISALGVEEQRVNVVIDFNEPIKNHGQLGDGFRVEARIVVWESDGVLKVPTSALFRDGEDWAVFVVSEEGVARLRKIDVGKQNALEAEVLSGLEASARVIAHPSDQISDGTSVSRR